MKNKVAPPFRQAEFDIEYGVGISHEGCLLDLALEHDLIQKSGSFFSYGELRLGQGRNNTKGYLAENPELAQEIAAKIFQLLDMERKPRPIAAVPDAPAPAEEARRRLLNSMQSPSARPPRRKKSAFELAVAALSRRELTVAELRARLAAREVDSAEAEEAIERLVEIGQLDDERYASLFAEDKSELFGWGPDRIRAAPDRQRGRAPDRRGSRGLGEPKSELAERAGGPPRPAQR